MFQFGLLPAFLVNCVGAILCWTVLAVHLLGWTCKLNSFCNQYVNDYQVGCFMYRCMNVLLPNDFCHMFAKYADFNSYATRNRDTVHMTTCRLNLCKHSILFLAPNYGTVCLWIVEILKVFIHLSGIINPFILTTLYLYYSLEFSFACTCFYQHLDIICVNINFQVVSS